MKKIILGSTVLLCISVFIIATQISCEKVFAQTNYVLPPATTSTLGGVIVGSGLSVSSTGVLSSNNSSGSVNANQNKFLLVDADSSMIKILDYSGNYLTMNLAKNLNLTPSPNPAAPNVTYIMSAKFSPDGSLIFVHTRTTGSSSTSSYDKVYSMDIAGNNVKFVCGISAYSNLPNSFDIR